MSCIAECNDDFSPWKCLSANLGVVIRFRGARLAPELIVKSILVEKWRVWCAWPCSIYLGGNSGESRQNKLVNSGDEEVTPARSAD